MKTYRQAQVNLQALMPEVVPQIPDEKPKAPWYEGMPDIDSVWPGISKQGLNWENYQGVYIVMEKINAGRTG